jgi:geranylgeranyl pyrophosphate synthase
MVRRMTQAAQLYGPVSADISVVTRRLRDLARGHHALLGETLLHVFESEGKRLRPALVLLCGKLGFYRLDALVTLAASLEAVHTATLVHDDTIDQALSRRGLRTVSAMWDSKVAILLGDFLFAQSAELASQLDSVRIMSLLSETVMAMSSAELRQYAAAQSISTDEAGYLERIRDKTATLFAICCQGAAIVSEQSDAACDALRQYGLNLGIAFQIADDVLDIAGQDATLGKPSGNDLRQGTVTLPVILFAQGLTPSSDFWEDLRLRRSVDRWIDEVRDSGALERALDRAAEFSSKAREALVHFPASEAKDALAELTDQVVYRQR